MNKNFNELTKFQQWAVLTLISNKKDFPFNVPFGIEIKINGVEVNPLDLLNRLDEEYRRQIDQKAIEIVADKFVDISDALTSLGYEVNQITKRWKEKISGITQDDWEL